METKLYEINVKLSQDDKERIFNAFIRNTSIQLILKSDALYGNDTLLIPHKIVKTGEEGYVLDEKIFHEMYTNGYLIIPAGEGKFRLFSPPSVVESLEKAREDNKGLVIDLDYSFSNGSIMYSLFKNVGNLIESIKHQ